MEVRVQYANYDVSEFKSLGEKDLNAAVDCFNSFSWEDETRKIENVKEGKTYPTIKFLKGNGEYVEINGFYRNGNICYNLKLKYKDRIWRVVTGLYYDKTKTCDFIVRYYNNNIDDNVAYVKANRKTNFSAFMDFLLYNFSDKDKIVDIDRNFKREFRYGLKPKKIIGASMYSIVLLLLFAFLYCVSSSNYKIIIVLSLIFLPLSILGLIVVINHFAYSYEKELIFEKNSDNFILCFGNHYQFYDKNNIEKINEFYTEDIECLPWGERKYWKIEMKNKEVILISNLIMNELDIRKHFDLTKIYENKILYPIIK